MPTTEDMTQSNEQDLATLLSRLPCQGSEDDVARVMKIYESAERAYRAAAAAGTPVIGASSSANR
jgi:hypothetical protein